MTEVRCSHEIISTNYHRRGEPCSKRATMEWDGQPVCTDHHRYLERMNAVPPAPKNGPHTMMVQFTCPLTGEILEITRAEFRARGTSDVLTDADWVWSDIYRGWVSPRGGDDAVAVATYASLIEQRLNGAIA